MSPSLPLKSSLADFVLNRLVQKVRDLNFGAKSSPMSNNDENLDAMLTRALSDDPDELTERSRRHNLTGASDEEEREEKEETSSEEVPVILFVCK